MNEVRRLGLVVPRELSVVGFDDGELRHMTFPTMSAVVQDGVEIGREAFEVLQELIESTGRLVPQQ